MFHRGSHYKQAGLEPATVIRAWGLNFFLGNVIKYVYRAGKKADNPTLQDLYKARDYINYEIAYIEDVQSRDGTGVSCSLQRHEQLVCGAADYAERLGDGGVSGVHG